MSILIILYSDVIKSIEVHFVLELSLVGSEVVGAKSVGAKSVYSFFSWKQHTVYKDY